MSVDFLSDSEAAKYGRYDGPPTRTEMEKIFFLDKTVRPRCSSMQCAGCARTTYCCREGTTLTWLVARERERTMRELHDILVALLSPPQRAALDLLLEVPAGKKVSELERGPSKASGPQVVKALDPVGAPRAPSC
ncbi:hypothetical protein [Streptosporangium roseum]|uniref:hypothetical protein n=1 Tax=Streptosporangium roseum TaxID=2001 RepID=UPI0004CD9FAB|nr:hypothetical protein [Streptosporangium roseum]